MHFLTFSFHVENAENVCPVLENSFRNAKKLNDLEYIKSMCVFICVCI